MRNNSWAAQLCGLANFRFQIRRFLHFSEEAAHAVGLEPQQHQLLLALRGIGGPEGATVRQLADRLLVRHHSAVELIDRLARRGFVARSRSGEDRRQVFVRLTKRGERKLEKLSRHHVAELRSAGPLLVSALRAVLKKGEARRKWGSKR